MLGFSPLAAAPLADDGVQSSIVVNLSASNITTGAPVVGSASISQIHVIAPTALVTGSPIVGASSLVQSSALSATGITTGAPIVGSVTVVQQAVLSPANITTGAPVVGSMTTAQTIALAGVSIVTGNPIIGSLFLNASRSRAVHVSQASNSVAAVTGSQNYSIIDGNTPNRAIVATSNEAA